MAAVARACRRRACVPGRGSLRSAALVLLLLLAGCGIGGFEAEPLPTDIILERDGTMQFWQADLLVSRATEPPPDTAAWRRVQLPDRWNDPSRLALEHPHGWYRLELPAGGLKRERFSVYLTRVNMNAAVYFNGDFVGDGGSFEEPIARNWNRPLLFELPASLWRAERNTLHIRLAGYPYYNTLAPVIVGPRDVLVPLWEWRVLLQNRVSEVLFVLTLLVSAIGFGFWVRSRESTYLLFAGSSLAWSLYSAHMFVRDVWIPARLWWPIVHAAVDWWLLLLLLFAHRLLGWRRPRTEAVVLGLGALFALADLMSDLTVFPRVSNAGHLFALLVGIYLTGVLTRESLRTQRTEIWLFAAGMWVIILLGAHDLLLNTYGGVEMWRSGALFVLNFGAPILFAVLIWHLSGRFVRALREAHALNAQLEHRVAATRGELEQSYARERDLVRRDAAAGERERIYRDLHDDVGAKLLSLVYAADKPATAELAREALQELRDIVSQGTIEARPLPDLVSDMRAEVEERCITADWQVHWRQPDVLPALEVNPTQVFHLQRIVREVVSNALRHAGGTALHCDLQWQAPVLAIGIEDDGRGFATGGAVVGGRGLRNIRQRAAELGASVDWLPAAGGGTRFVLQVRIAAPVAGAASSPDPGGGIVTPSR